MSPMQNIKNGKTHANGTDDPSPTIMKQFFYEKLQPQLKTENLELKTCTHSVPSPTKKLKNLEIMLKFLDGRVKILYNSKVLYHIRVNFLINLR